jgi:hypothetical protein
MSVMQQQALAQLGFICWPVICAGEAGVAVFEACSCVLKQLVTSTRILFKVPNWQR